MATPVIRRHVLDPIDGISEFLFGLVMALTFTCSFSAATSGGGEVRSMVLGAFGCNVAWGLVDAVMYLVGCITARGRGLNAFRLFRDDPNQSEVQPLVEQALPPPLRAVLKPEEIAELQRRMANLPVPPDAKLGRDDYLAAGMVFLLVVLATVPPTLPFLFIDNADGAVRISNLVAIALMYLAGRALGQQTGASPLRTGLTMVALGAVMVAVTVALGG
jgi:hypothetical protein